MMRAVPVVLLLAGALLGGSLAAAGAQTLPAALDEPALKSPRAAHSLTLGVAHAGKRLVAVGEHGIVLLSDDGGGAWRQAASVPVMVTLTAVRFRTDTEGWAAGHMGVILHTTDAGETWQRQIDGNGVAALARRAAANGSADAAAAAEQLVADGPDKPFLDIAVDAQSVLAVGAYGIAIRSADNGRTWTEAAGVRDPQGLHLYGLSAAGGIALLAGEQGFLAQSAQGGVFEPVQVPENVTLFGALVLPGGVRLAFGLGGRVIRAGAGEQAWTAVPTGLSGGVTCAVILPEGRVLIGTNTGELALADASGRGFTALHGGPPIPITAMLVDGKSLIITGPAGPVAVPLEYLDPGA